MALNSPGVEVKVVDESFYTPAAPGTVPLLIVASAENKLNGAGDGVAPGTLKANAGKVYLMTSQRELVDTFGDPIFKTDVNNNPIHAGEQNEYGLQAAYSALGITSRAFVVRADIDLNQLSPSSDPPSGEPENGVHWLDTNSTRWGIFEWNDNPATVTGGQTFVSKTPIVINDKLNVNALTGGPKDSIGAKGNYAIVTVVESSLVPELTDVHPLTLWYKTTRSSANVGIGVWIQVGSEEWIENLTTNTGGGLVSVALGTAGSGYSQGLNATVSAPNLPNGTLATVSVQVNPLTGAITGYTVVSGGSGYTSPPTITLVKPTTVTRSATGTIGGSTLTVTSIAGLHVGMQVTGSTGLGDDNAVNSVFISSIDSPSQITVSAPHDGAVSETLTFTDIGASGIPGTRSVSSVLIEPGLILSPHTQVPAWKRLSADPTVAPTGSIWVKTTSPNSGASIRVKRYNSVTSSWEDNFAPLYPDAQTALFNLDKSGGGNNLPVGQLYVKYNTEELGSPIVDFKLYRKRASAPTIIRTPRITATSFAGASNTTYAMTLIETAVGTTSLNTATVEFTLASPSETNVEVVAAAINASEDLVFVEASVDSQNRLVLTHTAGGDIHFTEGANTPLAKLGFDGYNPITGEGMLNLYADLDGEHDFVASLWEPLVYISNGAAPRTLTNDGAIWYSSVVDEVDMMVHNGTTWAGYRNSYPDTDTRGPFVTASAPETQRDGTSLENNDLWIDTADLENFPTIYRWSKDLQKWLLVNKSDQSTDEGIVFADSRYGTSGETSDQAGSIEDLLISNFIDFDAPDPALYPRGMLLWNLRRSGFNVKEFRQNYIDLTKENVRFDGVGAGGAGETMREYFPHRWVTISANQDDGSGSFGRKAQRKVVIQAMQAMVNSNQDMRDDESRIFNLMACPGYPELIGEMVSLNYDRGLTAFVIGDTPARLTSDATSLLAWGSNENLAVEDNDIGAVSFDEYIGMFYPWGFTSDNAGNNVVVPPSHMILRTILNNDQIAYPWFAPAGIRRGGVSNATSVGYVNDEGEFTPVALNVGQRDTLYDQKINPITFITGTGLVNYGQKTRSRGFSALDRINVARLVIYLRRQLSILAKPYIFEPNDKITRDEIKASVETLLVELVGQRALYDFLVVCDETNNTPARIDRNELWIDIAIEPVKAVEFIYIPLRLKNTGEISGLQ